MAGFALPGLSPGALSGLAPGAPPPQLQRSSTVSSFDRPSLLKAKEKNASPRLIALPESSIPEFQGMNGHELLGTEDGNRVI